METKQLEHFVQVAKAGSFSHAAIMLGVYQPALSKRIRELEDELHVLLFHRTGRGVVLTDAGKKLFDRAQAILAQIKDARSEIRGIDSGLVEKAVIAFPPTIGRVLSVPLTKALQRTFPGIQIQFAEAFSGTLLEWLAIGRVDVAILYDSGAAQKLNAEPILTERVSFVSRNCETTLLGEMPVARLRNFPLVLPSSRHGLRNLVDAAAAAERVELNVVVESDALSSLLELVRAGIGHTILSTTAIRDEIAHGVLQAVPLVAPEIERKLVLATATNRSPVPALARLVTAIKREVRALYSESKHQPCEPLLAVC